MQHIASLLQCLCIALSLYWYLCLASAKWTRCKVINMSLGSCKLFQWRKERAFYMWRENHRYEKSNRSMNKQVSCCKPEALDRWTD